jgi:hypothetical protein
MEILLQQMGGSVVVEVLLGCWRASYRSVKAKKIQLSSVPKLVFGAIYAVRFVKKQKSLPWSLTQSLSWRGRCHSVTRIYYQHCRSMTRHSHGSNEPLSTTLEPNHNIPKVLFCSGPRLLHWFCIGLWIYSSNTGVGARSRRLIWKVLSWLIDSGRLLEYSLA